MSRQPTESARGNPMCKNLAEQQSMTKMRGGRRLSKAGDKLDSWQEVNLERQESRARRAMYAILRSLHFVL